MSNELMAVKFADGSDDTLRILAIPYGGPINGSDLDGERFTKDTNLCLDWFPDTRPILYDHGHDGEVQLETVGYFKSANIEQNGDGVWITGQLNKSSRYIGAIRKLVGENKLFSSSGALGHLVKTAKNGNIEQWPWIEQSLTVSPSNIFARVETAEVAKHFKSAELEFAATDEVPEDIKASLLEEIEQIIETAEKALNEGTDSAGGATVPEDDKAKKPVEKKPTGDEKKALDFKEIFDAFYADPAAAEAFLAAHKSAEPVKVADSEHGAVLAYKRGDRMLFLLPGGKSAAHKAATEGAIEKIKSGEIVIAASRWGDAAEGSVEDWLQDLRRVLNQSMGFGGYFSSPGYVELIATYGCNGPGYSIVCVHSYDDDTDDMYYNVAFDMDDDGEPKISGSQQYQSVYMPITEVPAGAVGEDDDDDEMGKSAEPLKLHARFIMKAVAAFLGHTEGVHERRGKEGRALSAPNAQAVKEVVEAYDGMGESVDKLRTLVSDKQPEAKADVAELRLRAEAILEEIEASDLLGEVA